MIEFFLKQAYKKKIYIKFIISGTTAAVTDLALLYFFTDILGLWYLLSAILAFIIAYFVSFSLQKFWTFRDNSQKKIYQQMSLYFLVGVVNLGANSWAMYILVDKFRVWYILAQVIISGFLAVSNFLIYKLIIFKKRKKDLPAMASSKMKILIATGIYPPDIGGPATMLKALAKGLIDNGLDVKVITYVNKNELISKNKDDFKVVKVSKSKNILFRHAKYFLNMLKLALWADLVYVTDTYSVGRFAYLIKKLLGEKYIVRFAGDSAWETAVSNNWTKDYIVDFQKRKYEKKIERLKERRKKILLNADRVLAVSKFIAGIAQDIKVKEQKIKIIYNSIDFIENEFNQEKINQIKEKYNNNSKIIVTACRLTPWKGIDGIIKILPKLKKEIGGINLLVLGEGQELNNLKKLAKEFNISSNVYFLGRINHSEVMNYFKAADLFILNTNYEALSHTLLEAIKAEVPIITTNIGGNPEVIEDKIDGLLVNYNMAEDLFKASIKILASEQYGRDLAKNALKKLGKFNWQNNIKQTIKLIKEVHYE